MMDALVADAKCGVAIGLSRVSKTFGEDTDKPFVAHRWLLRFLVWHSPSLLLASAHL